MEEDVKRIGIGNNRFPSIKEAVVIEPEPIFTFDSEEIAFDSITRTFDEEI